MQAELKTVKEFRKQRTELQTELGQMKATLTDSELEHQRTLQALEQRFFEEKVSLVYRNASESVCVCVCMCV